MQAYIKDIATAPPKSHSFIICQRILHNVHEIIFSDLPPPTSAPYASLPMPFRSRFLVKKVKPHAKAAMAGIGIVLAGSLGMPSLNSRMGPVVIEQGRVELEATGSRSLQSSQDDVVVASSSSAASRSSTESLEEMSESESTPPPSDTSPPSSNTHLRGGSMPQRLHIDASRTAPALPIHLRGVRRSRLSEDPLGQLDIEPMQSPYQSSPTLFSSRLPPRSASINLAESLLQTYDTPSQTHMLKSHYLRSEVHFVQALENICNRLLVIPRPARVSALRAELTALNHKLPAEASVSMQYFPV